MSNQNRERLGLMQVFAPEIFREPGKVLYVGAYDRRFFGSGALYNAGNELTVLEIWQPFLDDLMKSRFRGRVAYPVLGDVTDLDVGTLPYETFDYTIWLHGPEHIDADKLPGTLDTLERITTRTILCTMPWGKFQHGVAYDNPYTEHKSHWYLEDWQKRKYRVACIGPMDHPGSQLQAWKHV